MSSSCDSGSFAIRRLLSYESIPSVGLTPPLLAMLSSVEGAVIDLLLAEVVSEVEAGMYGELAEVVEHPFWISPPLFSPFSDSDDSVASPVVDDEVPGLVLARALVPALSFLIPLLPLRLQLFLLLLLLNLLFVLLVASAVGPLASSSPMGMLWRR